MRRVKVLGAVLALAVLSGCSGRAHGSGAGAPGDVFAPTTPVGSGYLATGPSFVDYIQWTIDSGSFSGSAQVLASSGNPPNENVTSNTISVDGNIHGSSVTVQFNDGAPTFGTVSGDTLTLNFPQSDGSLAPITFHKATTSDFNSAVVNLHASVDSANQAATRAQQIQEQQQTVDGDISTVNSDLGIAQTSAADALKAMASALDDEKAALSTTVQSEQKVSTEAKQYPDGNDGQVCYDAGQVGYDAGQVEYEAGQVEYQTNDVQSAINGIRSGISTLNTDFGKLQTDEAALSPSDRLPAPTQADVNAAIDSANKTISSALAQANAQIDTANGYVAQATTTANSAAVAGNCSAYSSSFKPYGHLS